MKTKWEQRLEDACKEYGYESIEDFIDTIHGGVLNAIGSSSAVYKHAADLYAMRFHQWVIREKSIDDAHTQQLLEQFNNEEK